MGKKVLKIIDVIISIFFVIYFFSLQGVTGNYEYGLGTFIQIAVLAPAILLLFISIIMMTVSIFSKNDEPTIVAASGICKIAFYVIYILLRKFVLHITIGVDALIVVPILGLISLIAICINKSLTKHSKN